MSQRSNWLSSQQGAGSRGPAEPPAEPPVGLLRLGTDEELVPPQMPRRAPGEEVPDGYDVTPGIGYRDRPDCEDKG